MTSTTVTLFCSDCGTELGEEDVKTSLLIHGHFTGQCFVCCETDAEEAGLIQVAKPKRYSGTLKSDAFWVLH